MEEVSVLPHSEFLALRKQLRGTEIVKLQAGNSTALMAHTTKILELSEPSSCL